MIHNNLTLLIGKRKTGLVRPVSLLRLGFC